MYTICNFQKKHSNCSFFVYQINIEGIDPSWASLDAEFEGEYCWIFVQNIMAIIHKCKQRSHHLSVIFLEIAIWKMESNRSIITLLQHLYLTTHLIASILLNSYFLLNYVIWYLNKQDDISCGPPIRTNRHFGDAFPFLQTRGWMPWEKGQREDAWRNTLRIITSSFIMTEVGFNLQWYPETFVLVYTKGYQILGIFLDIATYKLDDFNIVTIPNL